MRDVTRAELPAAGTAAVSDRPGRQVRLVIWYPAASGGTAMTYGDYIEALAQTYDYRRVTVERRRDAIEAFIARAAGLGGDTAALRSALPVLRRTPVAARQNAAVARGRFPLVLFPEWRPPASNSILAEYLASHGFVVVSTALSGTYDGDVEYFAVRGIESLTADLAFALSAVDTIPYVDTRNAATIGVGIAATTALALQLRSPSVRAVVSLEGGITTEGEQRLLLRSPYFDVARIRAPILAITAPHPSVDAARLDLYRYSSRLIVHFPSMGEFWFLDYGMLESMVPRIIGVPPGNTVLGFEWAARFVERFLSRHLKHDTLAQRFLAAPVAAPSQLFTSATRPAVAVPPSIPELKRLIERVGAQGVLDFVAERTAVDSQPIPNDYFVSLNAWLGEGRDISGAQRRLLSELRVRLYRRSARAHAALAASALRMQDSTTARRHLEESVRLFAEDDDPLLDRQTRSGIERTARAAGVAVR